MCEFISEGIVRQVEGLGSTGIHLWIEPIATHALKVKEDNADKTYLIRWKTRQKEAPQLLATGTKLRTNVDAGLLVNLVGKRVRLHASDPERIVNSLDII